jgi:hypothetical protein
LLWQSREREALLTAGFIFAAYTPDMFLFEIVECARKLFLTSLIRFIAVSALGVGGSECSLNVP